jgi:Protein of unknown function (DUF1566)
MKIPAISTKTATPLAAVIVLASLMLISCGGGSATPDAAPTPTTPTLPEPPAPTVPLPNPPAPLTCNPGPGATASTGFSEVFKNCVGTLAVYYPLTECVRDNTTGLIWEGKPGTGPRRANLYLTNFDSTVGNQAWTFDNPPQPRPATQDEINAPTNTVGYINAVNSSGLCGGTWRLPNTNELVSLFRRLDPTWLPNQMGFWGYWSSTPARAEFPGFAHEVEYHGMTRIEVLRENGYFVRLVRN